LGTCFNEAAAESPRKSNTLTRCPAFLSGFNEAAAESPRKWHAILDTRTTILCGFNEAAAESPRKSNLLAAYLDGEFVLQ